MSKINDGGAAIDLRDYFAAKAMAACITAIGNDSGLPVVIDDESLAERSYEIADAMLAARKSREPEQQQNDSWIEWNGGECPVPEGAKFLIKFRDGHACDAGNGAGLVWDHYGNDSDIIAYFTYNNGDQK